MFGSKAEELYYKTMPTHEPYSFEEMRTRGQYSAVPSNRGLPITDPDGRVMSEWEARRQLIDTSGWAATNTAAYRPLGVPDLERRKSRLPVRRLDEEDEHGAVSAGGKAFDLNAQSSVVGEGKGPRKHEDRRYASDGMAELRAEVAASQDRARFCRTGGSFMNLVTRQRQGRLRTGAALADSVTPPRRRQSGGGDGGRKNNDDDDDSGGGGGGGEHTKVRGGKGNKVNVNGGGKKKKNTLATLNEDVASKPAPDDDTSDGGGLLFPPGFLPLDPAVTVKARSKEFEASAESMDWRLLDAIGQLRAERADLYRRKYASLIVDGPDGNVSHRRFNAEEWRLESEKRRIEARLSALERHSWYGRLLKLVPAGTASLGMGIGMGVGGGGAAIVGMGVPGGHSSSGSSSGAGGRSPGGGEGGMTREPTRAEINVVAAVRDVVENGHEFNRERFFQLLLILPMDDHIKGERLLTFIQLQLGISAEEYKDFATSTGIPLPPAVEALCLQKKDQKVSGSFVIAGTGSR